MLTQFLRYEPVARQIASVGGRTLLEVGGGSRGIAPYLNGSWEITNCDLSFDDYGAERVSPGHGTRRVTASVLELPFPDRSFDVVVALDLLEHIAPDDRSRALAELARVAGLIAVVGCPAGEAAQRADRLLVRLHSRYGRPQPGWLTEHFEHPFPEPELLARELQHHGPVTIVPNTNVAARVALAWFEFTRFGGLSRTLFCRLAPAVRRRSFRARAHGKLLRGLDLPPSYRTIVVLSKASIKSGEGASVGGRPLTGLSASAP